jgi:UDP-N-acetylglucosamine acyltransferase
VNAVQNEVKIHPTAIIEKGAQLGVGVEIGPYTVVGPKVILEDGVQLLSHVSISGRTRIGARTKVWPFASLGSAPQDLKYRGEDTSLVCGTDNMFRENVTISLGTEGGGGITSIGSHNLFMAYTHIAHDCRIENRCIFANGATLAGHIEVDDGAVVGGLSALHQFIKIGSLAMLAGGSMVAQDVPPYVMVSGNRAKPIGLNKVGIDRAKFSDAMVSNIKKMYKSLYLSSLSLDEAKAEIAKLSADGHEIQTFMGFLDRSIRGVCR